MLRLDTLPPRAASVSFDDGYADNLTVAGPIMRALQLPSTIFIATGFLDGGSMWNDDVIEAVRRLPTGVVELDRLDIGLSSIHLEANADRLRLCEEIIRRLKRAPPAWRARKAAGLWKLVDRPKVRGQMLTAAQVGTLDAYGIDVGAHTVNHPILSQLDDEAAEWEIVASRDALARITGKDVTLFAYPNGKPGQDYDDRHVAMVRRAGFAGAFSTSTGVAQVDCDPFQCPRFAPWPESWGRFAVRLVRLHASSR